MKLSSHLVYNPSCWQRNIDPEDYRTITDLMQPLDVYSVILVEFAPEGVRYPLGRALCQYRHHLYYLFEMYPYDSVLSYHFSFHQRRLVADVYDPQGWCKPDPLLHQVTLIRRLRC
jgi:hypothetical protein